MDGLSKLPPELLTIVFDELNPPDFKQIARVSRYLSKCVQQHLYRSVTFTNESHEAQTTPPVLSFLRLMLSYPDRRKRVQNLSFLGGYYEEWRRFACTSFQRSHLEEGLSGTQFEKTGQLVDELKSGGERCLDAAIAFLLLSLTSLRTVNIGVHLWPDSEAPYQSFVSGIIKHKIVSANQTTPLPLLEELSQCHLFSYKDERIAAAIEVLWFFYIPNIKILRVSMNDGDQPLQWPRSFPTLTALHTLILQHSDINLGDLRAIMMTSVPNIRHFEYHFRCEVESANRARHWLDCRTLREILELRADSLEHLALSINFLYSAMPIEYDDEEDDLGHDEWSIAYGIRECLGDMRRFTSLKYLQAPFVMLVGAEGLEGARLLRKNLPLSLQEFCCTNDMQRSIHYDWSPENVCAELDALIRSRKGRLQKLVIGSDHELHYWERWETYDIPKTCRRAGIEYEHVVSDYAKDRSWIP